MVIGDGVLGAGPDLRRAGCGEQAASGTLNDRTRLAAHQFGRPYLVVATAASMDSYTAFGAAITKDGFKQTRPGSAPRVVLADRDVLVRAPAQMHATGYGDLPRQITAGADWLLAAALAIRLDPAAGLVAGAGQPARVDRPAGPGTRRGSTGHRAVVRGADPVRRGDADQRLVAAGLGLRASA